MHSRTTRPPLLFIFGVTATGILANTLLTPAIPDILADFDQPDSRAGVLVGIGPIPAIVVAPIIGIMADRLGRRRVLIPCLLIFGVAGLAAATAQTFEQLLFARLIQGFGSAGLINLAVVLIGDYWVGQERTSLVGRNAAVLTASLAIVPSIAGILTELVSWRLALAISGVGIIMAIVAWFVLDDTRPSHVPSLSAQLGGAGEAIRNPVILATLVSGFLLFMVIFGVFLTTLPIHLENEFGLEAGARGLVLAVPAIGSTLVAYNLRRVRDRFSIRTLLAGASLCIAASSFVIGIAPTIILVVIAGIVYGLGDGAIIPTLQDVAVSATPDVQRAAVMAAWVAAVRAGQATGPILAAMVFGATSTTVAMILGAVVFLGVSAFFLMSPINDRSVRAAAA